jgi:glycerol uptake facilitator-like aquaporin
MISRWLIDALQALFNFQTGINQVWYSLFIVCFILTIIIMQYVIVPLGLKIDKQSSSSWETLLTFLLVFGFFIFMLNQVFEAVNMPGDWPIWLLRTFGGYDKLNLDLVDNSNRNFWSFIPWIWLLGPILVFYWPVLKEGAFGGGSSSKKDS